MLLDRRQFFIKEHVAFVKLTDTYDIIDPESGQPIGVAREEPAPWAKYARLLVNKQLMPTVVNVYEDEGSPPLITLRTGFKLFRKKVSVTNARGEAIGRFETKLMSFGVGFHVYDTRDNRVAEVKGDWKGWNFKFLDASGGEIGVVTKKWAGMGKEFFTSADNYMIALSDHGDGGPDRVALLLAAGLAIDIVFKEGS